MGVKIFREPQNYEQCAYFNISGIFWQDLSCDSNDRSISILVTAENVLNFTKTINNYKRSLFQNDSRPHAKPKYAL